MPRVPSNRRVVVLAYEGATLFELAIAVEIFGLPRPEFTDWYRFAVAGLGRAGLPALGGLRLHASAGPEALRGAGTVILPGWRPIDVPPPERLLDAVRQAHRRGARIVAICSGAFIAAAAGLLDGRRATAHWSHVEKLRALHPLVTVEPNVLYVDEGSILTSAGSAAGIDLCLHVVRRDYGAEVASIVARRLVVPPHREGGQMQYVREALPAKAASSLAPVLDWARSRLHAPLTIDDLARRAGVSSRTFARRFVAETGTTPHRWLTQQRLTAAQRRLETTNQSIDAIAEAVGFDTAGTLRHHFRRAYGVTPTSYRRRFTLRRRGTAGPKP